MKQAEKMIIKTNLKEFIRPQWHTLKAKIQFRACVCFLHFIFWRDREKTNPFESLSLVFDYQVSNKERDSFVFEQTHWRGKWSEHFQAERDN